MLYDGFKYFIEYENDDEKVMLYCIMLPKMSASRKHSNVYTF